MMRALAAVVVVVATVCTAPAQTFRGSIDGIVTDQTGATRLGADVKATNTRPCLALPLLAETA
jgi:hypothetical protein